MIRLFPILLAALIWGSVAQASQGAEQSEQETVGVSGEISVMIPGPPVVPLPIEDWATPIVLRVSGSRPVGNSVKYDLVYYATLPGKYDLRDFLKRQDGSPLSDVPAIPLEIKPAYEGDLAVKQVHDINVTSRPFLGGYVLTLILLSVLWIIVLLFFLFYGREKPPEDAREPEVVLTLQERLRIAIGDASGKELSDDKKAELERLVLEHWRRRLGGEGESVDALQRRLRRDPDAAPIVQALEKWFHHPVGEPPESLVAWMGQDEKAPKEDLP